MRELSLQEVEDVNGGDAVSNAIAGGLAGGAVGTAGAELVGVFGFAAVGAGTGAAAFGVGAVAGAAFGVWYYYTYY